MQISLSKPPTHDLEASFEYLFPGSNVNKKTIFLALVESGGRIRLSENVAEVIPY